MTIYKIFVNDKIWRLAVPHTDIKDVVAEPPLHGKWLAISIYDDTLRETLKRERIFKLSIVDEQNIRDDYHGCWLDESLTEHERSPIITREPEPYFLYILYDPSPGDYIDPYKDLPKNHTIDPESKT